MTDFDDFSIDRPIPKPDGDGQFKIHLMHKPHPSLETMPTPPVKPDADTTVNKGNLYMNKPEWLEQPTVPFDMMNLQIMMDHKGLRYERFDTQFVFAVGDISFKLVVHGNYWLESRSYAPVPDFDVRVDEMRVRLLDTVNHFNASRYVPTVWAEPPEDGSEGVNVVCNMVLDISQGVTRWQLEAFLENVVTSALQVSDWIIQNS